MNNNSSNEYQTLIQEICNKFSGQCKTEILKNNIHGINEYVIIVNDNEGIPTSEDTQRAW